MSEKKNVMDMTPYILPNIGLPLPFKWDKICNLDVLFPSVPSRNQYYTMVLVCAWIIFLKRVTTYQNAGLMFLPNLPSLSTMCLSYSYSSTQENTWKILRLTPPSKV